MSRKELKINRTKLVILTGDITEQDTEAIVNAANSTLLGGGGVDGAIHRAGGPQILEECKNIIKKIGRLDSGEAVLTGGGKLKARYVIHTVGPIWRGGNQNEETILKKAYLKSLQTAFENKLESVSFPSISTGAYRFPIEKAAKIALTVITEFIKENDFFEEIRIILWSIEDYKKYLKFTLDI